ncbi:hypothetical protein SAMN05660359_00928 [Geodermatophilus obscurus]|uniref:Uncharacterized protein n=1 Tax=Geodermatophilus obscurus TaxID=1861 RepID=A0A1I5DP62_9ACTN|nr:hypothetical protein SAMN05660359_00928 [Geodermatophilus obscurus]
MGAVVAGAQHTTRCLLVPCGAALLMVVFGVLVFVFGDQDEQVIGGAAFLIALVNAGMAVGQWPEVRAARRRTDPGLPS